MVKLVSENFKKFYFAPFASFAGLMCFFLYFISLIIALMLSFNKDGSLFRYN